MAWTTPRTWVAAENVTAALMNTHIKDNFDALKDPPSNNYECDEGADYTETLTTFQDVDGTNLSLAITTTGGDVMVHFHGVVTSSVAGGRIYFDVDVDGAREGTDDGITMSSSNSGNDRTPVTFTRLITGLSAGSHTFKLQWKTSSGTATLYGGGTASYDVHTQFWAREVT